MTRWQRADLLARHNHNAQYYLRRIGQDKFGGIIKAIVARVLGV